jgi:hypothetical protein
MALVNFIENQGAKMSNSSSSWMNGGNPGGRHREGERERTDLGLDDGCSLDSMSVLPLSYFTLALTSFLTRVLLESSSIADMNVNAMIGNGTIPINSVVDINGSEVPCPRTSLTLLHPILQCHYILPCLTRNFRTMTFYCMDRI